MESLLKNVLQNSKTNQEIQVIESELEYRPGVTISQTISSLEQNNDGGDGHMGSGQNYQNNKDSNKINQQTLNDYGEMQNQEYSR